MKLARSFSNHHRSQPGSGQGDRPPVCREGASVLLVARSAGPLRKAEKELRFLARGKGQQGLSHAGDVSDPEGCAAVAERAFGAFGGLTALVNNAGIQGMLGRLEEVPWEEWVRVIAVNLFGPALDAVR